MDSRTIANELRRVAEKGRKREYSSSERYWEALEKVALHIESLTVGVPLSRDGDPFEVGEEVVDGGGCKYRVAAIAPPNHVFCRNVEGLYEGLPQMMPADSLRRFDKEDTFERIARDAIGGVAAYGEARIAPDVRMGMNRDEAFVRHLVHRMERTAKQ